MLLSYILGVHTVNSVQLKRLTFSVVVRSRVRALPEVGSGSERDFRFRCLLEPDTVKSSFSVERKH